MKYKGTLTKLNHLDDAKHGPEDTAVFKSGEVLEISFEELPLKSERFNFYDGRICSTSQIQKILSKSHTSITFTTFNSTYKLENISDNV